jgi:IS5 family transposase
MDWSRLLKKLGGFALRLELGRLASFPDKEAAMSRERFKADTSNSFFGDFLYEQVIGDDHFLVQLKRLVPWERFTHKLVRYYRGRAKLGRPPYDPAMVLKMLLLAYLYNVSERQVEDFCNFYLPAKYFLGLGVDERSPDHSTLTAFKKRILENGKLGAFEQLLRDIIVLAMGKGIEFGAIQIMDSTHSIADVNVSKDEGRQSQGKPPRDGSAHWGVKRSAKASKGSKRKKTTYFYGYKAHVSLNAQTGLITSLVHTPGNAYDGHQLPRLLRKDLDQGLPVQIVTADRGYDDSDNHCLLWSKDIHSAISLNDYRTQKKDASKALWQRLKSTPQYKLGLRERYKIERKFGEAKSQHGLSRCRYLGLLRYAMQGFLTALALNLKRLVLLLTGVTFKGGATAWS